jgi:hypothetical protein
MAIKHFMSGERLTPTDAAKLILIGAAQSAQYWEEGVVVDVSALTEKEKMRIYEALAKQFDRLQKLFGYEGYSMYLNNGNCKHTWKFVRYATRHHKRTGQYIGQTIIEQCEHCGKRREVDCETGRIVRR